MKVFIWGVGDGIRNVIVSLSPHTEILGFIDSDKKKQQNKIFGKQVQHPDVIHEKAFDYIIIGAQMRYREISDQLERTGIDRQKIIQFYNYSLFFPRTFFYNDAVVKDDNYHFLFDNYVDVRIGG